MKAKAEAMRGWWVEKGTNRMEVKGVHRISGKWYVRGYAPKAKTRRCAPSTRMVWWKVKACSRQGDNTVEKGEVSRRIVEQQKRELASQDYWMDDENLKLRNEWMWRRHVDREEAMMHVYSDGSVKYAREEGTWAWEAHIAERPDRPNSTALHLVAAGDGKERRAPEATERVIRSGRAEPMALVAGLIALRAWKGSVAWYTDSQATIDTWNSLKYKSARKWASVDNKDVWRTLRRLKKEWGGRVNVIKVAAHQDSRKHDSCLALHELKNNIVDRQAERAYAKEVSMPLEALDAPRTSVITIEGRECIGKTKATIMNHVKVEKVKQWMLEQERTRGDEELMWGRAINVDWDMMLETGRTGTVRERRQRMRTMFNGLATNEWIRRQCDEDHDARCECGLKETQEHIICECTTKGVLKARKAMVTEVGETIFGAEGEKKEVPASMVKVARILRIKAGTKKLVDYDAYEDQPDWMGRQKGEAARRWLDDGTYPMWSGFIMKG